MEKSKKRREVASCTECYAKKQKCNHQYPCNHCARRRKPELCTYKRFTAQQPAVGKASSPVSKAPAPSAQPASPAGSVDRIWKSVSPVSFQSRTRRSPDRTLASCMGYATGSPSNLLGLMGQYHLLDPAELQGDRSHDASSECISRIRKLFSQAFPQRQLLDFLVQNFIKDVNWIHGLNHSISFLNQYDQFWVNGVPEDSAAIDFAVLLLEIAAYSAQFLPSSSYTADTIYGTSITAVREHCHGLATAIATLHGAEGGLSSLTGVQYYCYRASFEMNEGSIKEAWYLLGDAIRIELDLGLNKECFSLIRLPSGNRIDDLEIEMRRRVHWNLYVWDRHWSAVLDRQPYLKDEHCTVLYPQMRLEADSTDPDAPDSFMERTLQAKLAAIWQSFLKSTGSESMSYDPVAVEEQKERLDAEFISSLPYCFRLQDLDVRWDTELPKLPAQREVLHISIYALRCLMYRPLLTITAERLKSLPLFKRRLFAQHRYELVEAAIALLNSTSRLHSKINANQTKFFLISFYTFETAMVLVIYLYSSKFFETTQHVTHGHKGSDVFNHASSVSDDQRCRCEISQAITKLESLREVGAIAEFGSRKIRKVMEGLDARSIVGSNQGKQLLAPMTYQEILSGALTHHEYSPYNFQLDNDVDLSWIQTLSQSNDSDVQIDQYWVNSDALISSPRAGESAASRYEGSSRDGTAGQKEGLDVQIGAFSMRPTSLMLPRQTSITGCSGDVREEEAFNIDTPDTQNLADGDHWDF